MKKIVKSMLAVLLAVVMAFGGAPLAGLFGIEAQAASIPAVSSDLDYNLIKCKDELAYIAFSALSGSYNYMIVLSNDDYGFSETAYTYSSVAQTLYVWFDLGEFAYDSNSWDFSWNLKVTTYSGNTKGGTRTWSGLIDNPCYMTKVGAHMPIDYYGIYYSYNDGSENHFIQDWPDTCSGTTSITSKKPTRNGYNFLGWSTNRSATTPSYFAGDTVSFDHNRLSLYAVWSPNKYTVSYNANGGSGAPSAQTKTQDTTLWLSSTKPTKSYTVTYNANGGGVSTSSNTVNCTFKNWNTAQNGSGTAYAPGSSYTANSGATLYAQWTNPTYGTLPTPTRTGYNFDGWYTSASGGTKVTSSSTVSSNTTLYAHWNKIAEENIYNLGEETYSFHNFSDTHSAGHCFGMSVTSSGYYTGELDVSKIGITSGKSLYTVSLDSQVKAPICHYQLIQGTSINNAIVAADNPFKSPYNTESDWKEVVNYVKNHEFDNRGNLQILSCSKREGGHAVNFLYYSNVNGQDRIYVYDNNYPNIETYYYMDSYGKIMQSPKSTFDNALDSIAVMDIDKYLKNAESFDFSRVIYANEGEITVEGVIGYAMFGVEDSSIKYVYEIPANESQVKIIPLVDNAEFSYLEEEYGFGKINDETVGKFNLASIDGSGDAQSPGLTIENESKSIWDIIADFFMMIIDLLFGWLN